MEQWHEVLDNYYETQETLFRDYIFMDIFFRLFFMWSFSCNMLFFLESSRPDRIVQIAANVFGFFLIAFLSHAFDVEYYVTIEASAKCPTTAIFEIIANSSVAFIGYNSAVFDHFN